MAGPCRVRHPRATAVAPAWGPEGQPASPWVCRGGVMHHRGRRAALPGTLPATHRSEARSQTANTPHSLAAQGPGRKQSLFYSAESARFSSPREWEQIPAVAMGDCAGTAATPLSPGGVLVPLQGLFLQGSHNNPWVVSRGLGRLLSIQPVTLGQPSFRATCDPDLDPSSASEGPHWQRQAPGSHFLLRRFGQGKVALGS